MDTIENWTKTKIGTKFKIENWIQIEKMDKIDKRLTKLEKLEKIENWTKLNEEENRSESILVGHFQTTLEY